MKQNHQSLIINHQSLIINHQSEIPKAYQQGFIEFFKLKFAVTSDVLIPRPETELLVEEIIKYISSQNTSQLATNNYITILDIGTGSGCIAITLAKNIPGAKIIATDSSEKALTVARSNAKFHHVENNIQFIKSDLLNFLVDQPPTTNHEQYLIATNLPYIPSARIPYLDSSVKDFEPWVALDGGEDGFELYRRLFTQIRKQNLQIKFLIGEIDYTQGELAVNEAQKYFPQAKTEILYDLTHKQRILRIDL